MSSAPSPSPLLQRPGAVPADPPDTGVAAHYGDPYREQRLLDSGVGLVDLSHRPVLRLTGPDRLSWLHSLSTQHLSALAPGAGTEALILSPTGHVEYALALVDDGETTWVHVEPGTAGPLERFLVSMRFMMRVDVVDASADVAVVWSPRARPDLEPLATRAGRLGTDLLLSRSKLDGLPDDLAGLQAYEARRVAAGIPRLGLDTDARTIPHEVGWIESAVHLSKGCYRGQETVARVHNLGRPPRRLVRLHLDGSVDRLPAPGDAVEYAGAPVGFVGTSVRHFELGPLALALVKRTVPVADSLTVAGIAATQEEIVRADTGPAVTVPKMDRGIRPLRPR